MCEGKQRQRQTKEKVGMSGRSLRITMKLVGEQEPRPKDTKTILTLAGYSSWPHVTSWGLEETANKYQVRTLSSMSKTR